MFHTAFGTSLVYGMTPVSKVIYYFVCGTSSAEYSITGFRWLQLLTSGGSAVHGVLLCLFSRAAIRGYEDEVSHMNAIYIYFPTGVGYVNVLDTVM